MQESKLPTERNLQVYAVNLKLMIANFKGTRISQCKYPR